MGCKYTKTEMKIQEQGGWVGCKYTNTEMKIQRRVGGVQIHKNRNENTGAGWLGGMQIQMQIEENLGVVQLRTSLLDNFASIIRDYCQIKVSLRFKLLVKFAGNISTREDRTKLCFSESVPSLPPSSCCQFTIQQE